MQCIDSEDTILYQSKLTTCAVNVPPPLPFNVILNLWDLFIYLFIYFSRHVLTLSQTSPGFYVSAVEVF